MTLSLNINPDDYIQMGWYLTEEGSLVEIYDYYARRFHFVGKFMRANRHLYTHRYWTLDGKYMHKTQKPYTPEGLNLKIYLGLDYRPAMVRLYRGHDIAMVI